MSSSDFDNMDTYHVKPLQKVQIHKKLLDFSISFQGREVTTSKVLLAAHSEYFFELFQEEKSKDMKSINLENFSDVIKFDADFFEVFIHILKLITDGKTAFASNRIRLPYFVVLVKNFRFRKPIEMAIMDMCTTMSPNRGVHSLKFSPSKCSEYNISEYYSNFSFTIEDLEMNTGDFYTFCSSLIDLYASRIPGKNTRRIVNCVMLIDKYFTINFKNIQDWINKKDYNRELYEKVQEKIQTKLIDEHKMKSGFFKDNFYLLNISPALDLNWIPKGCLFEITKQILQKRKRILQNKEKIKEILTTHENENGNFSSFDAFHLFDSITFYDRLYKDKKIGDKLYKDYEICDRLYTDDVRDAYVYLRTSGSIDRKDDSPCFLEENGKTQPRYYLFNKYDPIRYKYIEMDNQRTKKLDNQTTEIDYIFYTFWEDLTKNDHLHVFSFTPGKKGKIIFKLPYISKDRKLEKQVGGESETIDEDIEFQVIYTKKK